MKIKFGVAVLSTLLFAQYAMAQEADTSKDDGENEAAAMVNSDVDGSEKQMESSSPPETNKKVETVDDDERASAARRQAEADRLSKILRKLQKEPPLESLIVAALKLASADVESAQSWMRRVRLSPLLPNVKVSAGYDMEHDESLDRSQVDPDEWGADTDNDLALSIALQWNFANLVFHPDELKIYNALADRSDRREAIIASMIGHWFERRQLQILLAVRPPQDMEERIRQTLRINELTARIDALTGGALARKYYESISAD